MFNKHSKMTRRQFAKSSILVSASATAALSLEERTLLAQQAQPAAGPKSPPAPKETLPMGKIGNLELSRLILGGNLIGGYAHSRELRYVSVLIKNYFTPEKIMDTFERAEMYGINCVNTTPNAASIMQRYWKERGGKIKWIAYGSLDTEDNFDSIKRAIDTGAGAVYVQGAVAEKTIMAGKIDLLAKALELIQLSGVPAGVAGHALRVPMECEKAKLKADFYVKTLHLSNYFSYQRPENKDEFLGRHDNMWCVDAGEVIEFMKKVEKPWIAYKVMAAGAIPPTTAFRHAFDNGADFILAGIFDFQIEEDVQIAKKALANVKRTRPWRA